MSSKPKPTMKTLKKKRVILKTGKKKNVPPAGPSPSPSPKPIMKKTSYDHDVIDPDMDVQNFLHLSDVHIRPLDRHREFSNVFTNLYADIDDMPKERRDKTMIVITGDVFDHKTNFKPETFEICRSFLKNLAKRCRTIVIAGNHDMLENNTKRLDSLTPVASDIDNLHYLKYSGLYQFGKTVFSVSSLYDKEFIRSEDIDKKSDCKYVALYHGALIGSTTDTGQVINDDDASAGTTRFRKVADFDGYDAVLLGDIHKAQTLGAEDNIAYAGSLIQQNFGENLAGHGYRLWDVNDLSSSKIVEIDNQFGHVDVKMEKGEWIGEEFAEFPHDAFVRIVAENCTESQISEVENRIKLMVKGKVKFTRRIVHANAIEKESVPLDVIRKDDEKELMKEELEKSGDVDEIKIDEMLELHDKYQAELKSEGESEIGEEEMNAFIWRPMFLEFKNMFGYGGNRVNSVIFKSGITCISAKNTYGKTSLINIILFTLFGQVPLNPVSRATTFDIINNDCTTGYVKMLVNYGNDYYIIERRAMKKRERKTYDEFQKKLKKYEFEVKLYKATAAGDVVENLSETKKNTDNMIVQLFGKLDDFSITNFLDKESSKDLIFLKPAEQIAMLKKMFRLEVFDKLKAKNYDEIKKVKKSIIKLTGERDSLMSEMEDIDADLDTLEAKVEDLNEQIHHKESMLQEKQSTVEELIELIQKHREWLQSMEFDDDLLSMNEEEIAGLKEKLTSDLDESILEEGDTGDMLEYKLSELQSDYNENIKWETSDDKQYSAYEEKYGEEDLNRRKIDKQMAVCRHKVSEIEDELADAGVEYEDVEIEDELEMESNEIKTEIDKLQSSLHDDLPDEITETSTEWPEETEEEIANDLRDLKVANRKLKMLIAKKFMPTISKKYQSMNDEDIEARITELSSVQKQQAGSDFDRQEFLDALAKVEVTGISPDHLDINSNGEVTLNLSKMALLPDDFADDVTFYRGSLWQEKSDLLVEKYSRNTKKMKMLKDKQQQYAYKKHLENETVEEKIVDYQFVLRQRENATLERLDEQVNCLKLRERKSEYDKNEEIGAEIDGLESRLEMIRIKDTLKMLKIMDEMKTRKNKLSNLERKKNSIAAEVSSMRRIVGNLKRDLGITEEKVLTVKRSSDKLDTCKKKLVQQEEMLNFLKIYDKMVGTKGVPSKMLFNKIKAIEDYINCIISEFTDYDISMIFDENKQSIHTITHNKKTDKYLSATRFSGFEKFILRLAFKRALNKFSYNSKSAIIIIDEALDCIDQENFTVKLPMIINLLCHDYQQLLLISQRDIAHVTDNVIKIDKDVYSKII